ncbi:MAG TPA: IS66 family transposase [Pseudonocardia sp.]|nr:IS66 family transposase [Pseudonocardia sp.]
MSRQAPPTYDDLLGRIAALDERVAVLEAENARLRAENARLRGEGAGESGAGGAAPVGDEPPARSGRRRPPGWVKANVVVVARRRPRQARAPVPGRRREVPDRVVVHAPAVCPHCATALRRGRLVGCRQVLVLPPVRAEVVEHRVLARTCPGCGAVCRGTVPDLGEQVGPHRRVSRGIAALAATLRTKLRLPLAQLQWLLRQGFGLRLSVGELSEALAEAARAGQRAYEALLAEARASPVVHVDETGWREDGQNGWVWVLSTPTVRVFQYSRSRAGAVAERLLGEPDAAAATVVSDFYAGYDRLARTQQRCWAHLVRDVRALCADHPDEAAGQRWAHQVRRLYGLAVAWAASATAAGTRPILRERLADRFAAELVRVCRRQPVGAPQATLCQRIERYRTDLFTFVADSAVEPTNNAAERALRPLVVARKVSGGTRSAAGSRTRMVLQSLVATWELRGLDPVAEFLALLRAPRSVTPDLAPV